MLHALPRLLSASVRSALNPRAIRSSIVATALAATVAATLACGGCDRPSGAPAAGTSATPPVDATKGAASSPSATPPTTPPTTPPSTPPSTPPATAPEIHATFVHSTGTIRVRLASKEAPRLTMSFINLAERGYFNGRTWSDFSPVVRQTGDPAPLYTLPREFSPKLLLDVGGRLCVSNTSDDHTARAKANRIFLTVKEQDRWNLVYCVFGTITDGLEYARTMRDGEVIDAVRIEGDASALRARFAKELVEWNAAIDAAPKRIAPAR
jgi:cyclophilin family peptidyl-prolyl cis-trans isomerase